MKLLGLACALLALAAPAGGAPELKKGGTLRVAALFLPASLDPLYSDYADASLVHHAVGLTLFGHVRGSGSAATRLVPEAASRYAVSKGGKVYTFTLRSGFRFSNGQRVTASHFRHAIERALDPRANVYARSLITGPEARAPVKGVRSSGNRLVVTLAKPSTSLLGLLASPFFQAVPLTAGIPSGPASHEAVLTSAGPYAITTYEPRKRLVLTRNPFYGGRRPRHLDAIEILVGIGVTQAVRRVEEGTLDYAPYVPTELRGELVEKYGVNRQLRVNPSDCVSYVAFNQKSELFRNNPALRRAVGYAIDRTELARAIGAASSRPHDQLLPPSVPGFRNLKLFPLEKPDLRVASRLASGHRRHAHARLLYSLRGPTAVHRAVQRSLASIGIQLELKSELGLIPDDGDLFTTGWCAEDELGDRIHNLEAWASLTTNAALERKARAARRLRGAARRAAAERLERELVHEQALVVPWGIPNVHELLSARVDPRSFRFHPVHRSADLASLALR